MLPTLPIPEYVTEMPSSKKKVRFRPFLTGEKKVLLIAKETGDKDQVELAILNIIKTCTFNEFDVDNVPFFDAEWVFVKIVEKSIGEAIPLIVKCDNCGKENEYELDLSETTLSSDITDSKIMLADNLGLTIHYPSTDQIKKLKENQDTAVIFDLIVNCIDTIFTDKTVYQAKDSSRQEIIEWIDKLDDNQFGKIEDFLLAFPTLRNEVKFTCKHCNTKNSFFVDGLEDFFL